MLQELLQQLVELPVLVASTSSSTSCLQQMPDGKVSQPLWL